MLSMELANDLKIAQNDRTAAEILGWLLNPQENHNIKNTFLEDFMFLISEKIDTCDDIQINTFYDMGKYGLIDILLETRKTIYAIKCGDLNDNNSIGNLYTYKYYLEEVFKTNKKITSIYISIAPIDFEKQTYIKHIGYYDIAEILPDIFDTKKQKLINKFSDLIQEKSAISINKNYSTEDIKDWKKLNKYGRIVRKIAKYFDLNFDYELFRPNYRRYAINISKDIFLIFNCEKANLKVVIKKRSNNILNIVQKVSIYAINTKSLDEIITSIKKSNILENFK